MEEEAKTAIHKQGFGKTTKLQDILRNNAKAEFKREYYCNTKSAKYNKCNMIICLSHIFNERDILGRKIYHIDVFGTHNEKCDHQTNVKNNTKKYIIQEVVKEIKTGKMKK